VLTLDQDVNKILLTLFIWYKSILELNSIIVLLKEIKCIVLKYKVKIPMSEHTTIDEWFTLDGFFILAFIICLINNEGRFYTYSPRIE